MIVYSCLSRAGSSSCPVRPLPALLAVGYTSVVWTASLSPLDFFLAWGFWVLCFRFPHSFLSVRYTTAVLAKFIGPLDLFHLTGVWVLLRLYLFGTVPLPHSLISGPHIHICLVGVRVPMLRRPAKHHPRRGQPQRLQDSRQDDQEKMTLEV